MLESPPPGALEHQSDHWSVRAVVEPADGLLTVARYHLGHLPVECRMTAARELPRQRLINRQILERRAAAMGRFLTRAAAEQGCHKVSLAVPPDDVPLFLAAGYRVEAVVEDCYRGVEARAWLAAFPAGASGEPGGAPKGDGSPDRSAAPNRDAPAVAPDEALPVRLWDDWGCAEARCDRWASPEPAAEEVERLARELKGRGIRTLLCLARPGSEAEACLRQAGCRYRGRLAAHARGEQGPEDLALWVRSAADIARK